MNTFEGIVAKIEKEDDINVIYVHIKKTLFKLLRMDLPEWIEVGDSINCTIQEASIAICKGEEEHNKVSIENRIQAKVSKLRESPVFTEVTLESGCGSMVALITTEAAQRLQLEPQDEVISLLKAVDIKIEPALESVFI